MLKGRAARQAPKFRTYPRLLLLPSSAKSATQQGIPLPTTPVFPAAILIPYSPEASPRPALCPGPSSLARAGTSLTWQQPKPPWRRSPAALSPPPSPSYPVSALLMFPPRRSCLGFSSSYCFCALSPAVASPRPALHPGPSPLAPAGSSLLLDSTAKGLFTDPVPSTGPWALCCLGSPGLCAG